MAEVGVYVRTTRLAEFEGGLIFILKENHLSIVKFQKSEIRPLRQIFLKTHGVNWCLCPEAGAHVQKLVLMYKSWCSWPEVRTYGEEVGVSGRKLVLMGESSCLWAGVRTYWRKLVLMSRS